MLINSYNFGRGPGSNIPAVLQNTIAFKLDNATSNQDTMTMTINAGSTIIVVTHHMMLNGNNDNTIVSDNTLVNGYATQGTKSTWGSAAGSAKRGSVQVHKSNKFGTAELGGAQGTVKIFVRSNDANIANIRTMFYGIEVSNLANSNVVTTDYFSTNTASGDNVGNNKPNVFMSGWSQQNTFIIAAASGSQANQFSFNASPYPASSHGGPTWQPLWIQNEASGTSTGNIRLISNYIISSSNAGTLISDWTSSFNTAPWSAIIMAFKST